MRKKPNLAARMAACGDLIVTAPEAYRGCWLSEFGYDALHIEIGCGKGRFTVEAAKAEPDVLFAAIERSADAMIIAVERAAAEGVRNIKFMVAYADRVAEYFAPGEASRIYLNFSDPWPSNRHEKRRLTNRRHLEIYSQALRSGGEIRFKTDNLRLFEYSLREFEQCGFYLQDVARDIHRDGPVGVMTDYELKFYGQGLPIYQCIAVRTDTGSD